MSRRGSGGGVLPVVLSLIFVLACGGVFFLVASGRLPGLVAGSSPTESASGGDEGSGVVQPKDFASYSWDELASVAGLIEQAGSEDAGLAVAKEYGIVSGDGVLNDCVRQVVLADGSAGLCRVVGVLADDKADGSGKAGLTFMLSGLGSSSINSTDTCDGGWGSSELRAWLNSEGVSLLPEDLRGRVAEVSKLTNNVGITNSPADVSPTADSLWLFSASEIYGDLTWFEQEYGDGAGYHTDYTDFAPYAQMINSEGSQYLYFAQNGVGDRSEYAAVAGALGNPTSNFWLRTAYPLSISAEDAGQFYQVMASGYPSTVAAASQKNKIIAGFCL